MNYDLWKSDVGPWPSVSDVEDLRMEHDQQIRDEFVQRVLRVEKQLPRESEQALHAFLTINPHMRGAAWADVLDNLVGADAAVDIVEKAHERYYHRLNRQAQPYLTLVVLTLYYAGGCDGSVPGWLSVCPALARVIEGYATP